MVQTATGLRARLLRHAMLGGLVLLVLLLAWLQFRWLAQLRYEEEARRRAALRIAASSFQERVNHSLSTMLQTWRASAGEGAPPLHSDWLLDSFSISSDSPNHARIAEAGQWRPATTAELQQALGRPLLDWLQGGDAATRSGLWLDPPALVHCADVCRVGRLDRRALGHQLRDAAAGVFSEFEGDLRVAVVQQSASGQALAALSGPALGARQFEITDLSVPLLTDVRVLGPADRQWRLLVNHDGSALETVVARSHLRNVLLSTAVLALLALSIAMVLLNSRRLSRLAQRQLLFAAGVSHELRTPLSVIGSAADNLADGTVSTDERVRRYGELIRGETRRLGGMIENVLQFSRLSAASGPRVRTVIAPGKLVDDAVTACAPILENVDLQLVVADDLPEISGDPQALQSVLVNLIQNGVRYAQGEPRWLRLSATTSAIRPRGRALRYAVSNPVVGRADASTARWFEPFYRGPNAIDRGITGTGIGLAVAQGIARQHGGGLSVDTARSGVVTVAFYLPILDNVGDTS